MAVVLHAQKMSIDIKNYEGIESPDPFLVFFMFILVVVEDIKV